MYIKKITINNFQSFHGEHIVELSKGVNIFHGKNDSGKSKLFNVFNWGFFNRIYGRDQEGVKDWHSDLDSYGVKVCNHYALSNIDINETIKMGVEIVFSSKIPRNGVVEKSSLPNKAYEQEVDYYLKRSISFKLNAEKEFSNQIDNWSLHDEEFDLYFKFGGTTFFIEDPNLEIGFIFPFEIRDYMWFQGEAIEDLVAFKDSNKLREAINKISYYPVYEKLSDLMEDAVNMIDDQIIKKNRKNQRDSNTYNTISSNISDVKRTLAQKEELKKELKEKIDSTNKEINKIKSKVRTVTEYPKYFEIETTNEAKLNSALESTEKLDYDRKEYIIKQWMMKGVDNYKADLDKILEDYEAKLKSESPSNNPLPLLVPGEEWVNKMIADGMCHVCERSYDKDVDVAVHEALLRRSSNANIEKDEKSKQLNYFYAALLEKSEEVISLNNVINHGIIDFNNKVVEKWNAVTEAREALRSIRKKIQDKFGASSIANEAKNATQLFNKLEVLQENLLQEQRRLNQFENAISDLNRDLLSYKKELSNNTLPSNVKIKEVTYQKYFNFLKDSLNNLKDEAFTSLLDDIQKKANDLYKDYLSHRSTDGGELIIDKNTLELSNFTNDGSVRDSNQSNEDIAKISVINAILTLNAEKTGIHFPFITDAPSSSFDMETTIAYTSALPKLFNQCIIISKDFDDKSIDSLKKSKDIKSIFNLKYGPVKHHLENIQENSATTIKKIK